MNGACDDCLRRADLVAALSGWLAVEWRRRDAPARVLALSDDALLDACGMGEVRRRYAAFDPVMARERVEVAGLAAYCRCDDAYPSSLRELHDPPAVLHVAGSLERAQLEEAVAVVGARRATDYGLTVARGFGRSLTATGVTVVSGLALGVDSAAHAGAMTDAPAGLDSTSPAGPVAVLAGGADRPYPASKRQLYAAVKERGAVVSEMPPGTGVRRWAFVARNRLIAALAKVVVVVEATERSGSLTTADLGAELGRTVAAVPGRVTCPLAAGTHALLRDGALLVRDARDVLDALSELTGKRYDVGARVATQLAPALRRVLDAIGEGHATAPQLAATGLEIRAVLAGLGELEARGLIRRGFGGRYERVP